jgi:hypothetical protein
MSSLLHSVSIGLACIIGWKLGVRLAKFFGFCLLLAAPLEAQGIWYGDTAAVSENRPTRGYFFVDTSTAYGNKKWDSRKPWVEQVKPPLYYYDWWRQTADCQGFRLWYADFKKWRWFVVNSEIFGNRNPFQLGFYGYLLVDSMAVYIARPKKDDRIIITHEMTHAMQYLNGEKVNHSFRRFGPFGCSFSYVDPETADPYLKQ